MIDNLKKWFNTTFFQDQYSTYRVLEKELLTNKERLDEIVKSYNDFKVECDNNLKKLDNKFEKGNSDKKNEITILKSHINQKYNNYFSEYIDEVKVLKDNITILKAKIDKMLKNNPNLIKEEKENFIKATLVLMDAWEAGLIDENQLKEIQKKSREMVIEKGWDFTELQEQTNKVEVKRFADVIVKNKKGEVLLLLRNRNAKFEPATWCLPGGHIDLGETEIDAAVRELREETGIELSTNDLIPIYNLEIENGTIYYYEAFLEKDVEVRLLESEHINYVWARDWSQLDLILNLETILDSTKTI